MTGIIVTLRRVPTVWRSVPWPQRREPRVRKGRQSPNWMPGGRSKTGARIDLTKTIAAVMATSGVDDLKRQIADNGIREKSEIFDR